MASGWENLLGEMSQLIKQPEPQLWKQKVPEYLRELKACAKRGGEPAPADNLVDEIDSIGVIKS